MFVIESKKGKKKDKKWSKDKIDRSNDLAERMMASKDFEGDWSKAYALSRWMENKGYDVKKKPGKPHKKYKSKKAEIMSVANEIIVMADQLDSMGFIKDANILDDVLEKMAADWMTEDLMKKPCEDCGSPFKYSMLDDNGRCKKCKQRVEL